MSYSDRRQAVSVINRNVEPPTSSRKNVTSESGFMGYSQQIDTLKNSQHQNSRQSKFKDSASVQQLDKLDPNSVSIWTKKQTSYQKGKSSVTGIMEKNNLQYLQNQSFLRKLINNEVNLAPKYGSMTQPPQEVIYARERYQPDKVKIMMTKSVQQRDQYQFGVDIGIPTRENTYRAPSNPIS